MYGVAESPYCTPETNVTLYVNYAELKTKQNKTNKNPEEGGKTLCPKKENRFMRLERGL